MRAVLCLVRLYFTATPLARGCLALGLLLGTLGLARQAATNVWPIAIGRYNQPVWHEALLMAVPWFGLILLLAASVPLPLIVERIALGRAVWTLPRGRFVLLTSVVLAALLLAVVTATASTMFFVGFSATVLARPELYPSLVEIFGRTLLMSFIDFGLIYTAVWLVSKTSGVWRLAGLIWAIVSITIPFRYSQGIPPFSMLEGVGLASWFVFGALLLTGGRLRHSIPRQRAALERRLRTLLPAAIYTPGNEPALLLGTTRPWFMAIGQVVPGAVMAVLIPESSIWLVILLLFSAISGAVSSQAATRARRLWLRYGWTRVEIARRVEVAFLQFSLSSLGVLLLVFAGLALFAGLGATHIVFGVLLLAVGSITCTYLGLLVTRGLGWFESALAILTMIALTLAGIAVARGLLDVAVRMLALLVVLVVVYRILGRRRWLGLDWMLTRTA